MERFQSFEGPKVSMDDNHDPVAVRSPSHKGKSWTEVEWCRKKDCRCKGAFARSFDMSQGGTFNVAVICTTCCT